MIMKKLRSYTQHIMASQTGLPLILTLYKLAQIYTYVSNTGLLSTYRVSCQSRASLGIASKFKGKAIKARHKICRITCNKRPLFPLQVCQQPISTRNIEK